MKNILVLLILTLSITLFMVACGNDTKETDSQKESQIIKTNLEETGVDVQEYEEEYDAE